MTGTCPGRRAARTGGWRWRMRARHRLHEPETPVDRASDAEIVALLGACLSARDRLIVLLMARAGLRRGEVCGLRRSDVHLLADSRPLGCEVARAHLHVVRREDNPNGAWAKSRRQRAVPLDFLVVQAFDTYELERMGVSGAAGSDFVLVNLFRGPVGAPMRPRRGRRSAGRGVPPGGLATAVTPHQLRHAFGSNAADAGCGIDVVADLLGHASVSSSQVYVHPDPGRLRAAVDAGAQPARAGGGDPVTGAAAALAASPAAGTGGEFPGVLDGVAAGRDRPPAWPRCWIRRSWPGRAGIRAAGCCPCPPGIRCWAGWYAGRAAAMPPRMAPRPAGCAGGASPGCTRAGLSAGEITSSPELPPLPDRPPGCAVPGCLRMSPGGRQGQRTGLCQAHSRRFRRVPGMTMERFLADPRVRPLPALGPCNVAACARRAESEHGYCPTHYVRWRQAVTACPGADQRHWQLTEPAVSEGGQVSLRGTAAAGGDRGAVRDLAAHR